MTNLQTKRSWQLEMMISGLLGKHFTKLESVQAKFKVAGPVWSHDLR
jgi:hypothetical protein